MKNLRKTLRGARLLNRGLSLGLYGKRRRYRRASSFKRNLQLLIFISGFIDG